MTDLEHILSSLDDMKGVDITPLDVSTLTSITDHMVIVTGKNTRHTRSMMLALIDLYPSLTCGKPVIEGDDYNEWILMNFGDVIVHIMLAHVRDYYAIEKLWSKDL